MKTLELNSPQCALLDCLDKRLTDRLVHLLDNHPEYDQVRIEVVQQMVTLRGVVRSMASKINLLELVWGLEDRKGLEDHTIIGG